MSSSTHSVVLSTPQSRHMWRAWIERLLAATLVFTFVMSGWIPAWKTLNTDFPNYYLAARLFHEGYAFERVYDWVWFQRQKDHVGIDRPIVGAVLLTPPSLILLSPWSSLPPLLAKRRWLLANVAFLLVTILLLKLITDLKWRQVALLTFLAIAPLRNNFLFGQMHVLVLLLIALATYLYFRNHPLLSGIVFATAAALKIYPAIFLLFFLLKKQWRAALGLAVGLVGVVAACIGVFGMRVCHFYLWQLPWALRGETLDPYNTGWNSLAALLRRLFIAEPELNPAPVVHAPWVYSLLYPSIQAAILVIFAWAVISKTADKSRLKLEWATFISLLLSLSPQPVSYHFVVLIVPIILATDYLLARAKFALACALVLIYALVSSPYLRGLWASAAGWKNLLCFPRLFLMVMLCGLLLGILISSSESIGRHLGSHQFLLAATAFVAIVSVCGISSLRHFNGQFDNYSARVTTTPDSLMAAEPMVSSDSVLFTSFAPQGYAVSKLASAKLTTFRSDGDWLHPAVGTAPGTAWAEVATERSSRIVRFTSNDPDGYEAGMVIEAENAEQPVVSSDGKWLLFIRESKGHGSLWLEEIAARGPHPQDAPLKEIASLDYDVRQAAFFPDHRLVFSSSQDGQLSLYIADPESNKIEMLKTSGCSAGYPSVSPDGHRLAFSCEHHGIWQLSRMDLASGKVSEMTHADCNSISPAWSPDSRTIVYATDCGRGAGLTALATLRVEP